MTTRRNLYLLNQAQENNTMMDIDDSILIGHEIQEDRKIGKGVFTYKYLKKGEMATYFSGWVISRKDADLLKTVNTHSHILTRTYCTDSILGIETMEEKAQFQFQGFGSFINHSDHPNVEFRNIDGHICVKTLRNIQTYEELYVSYGTNYWQQNYNREESGIQLRQEIIQRSEPTTFSLETKKTRRL